MRTWGLSGPAAAAHITDVPQVAAQAAAPNARQDEVLRVGADAPRGRRFLQALELVHAFAATPTAETHGLLLHALDRLSELRPAEHPSYEELVAVRRLRREIHGIARNPAHAELAWRGSVIARFVEAYRDGGTCTALCLETYSKARGVRWKANADAYYGPEQARATYDVLNAAGVMPPADQPLRFISAAANAGTHEAAIFERDAEVTPDRKGGRQFIVGDIAKVPTRALPGPIFGPGFLHVRWDADRLPLAPDSIDVIWDRKGRTWFALMNDIVNDIDGTRSPLTALGVLQHYRDILKPGGHVVLDAIDSSAVKAQNERSTDEAIRAVAESSAIDVARLIGSRFDLRYVGEGVTRCLVLRKPSA